MYLITHPRRMFRVGDKVLHVGQGNTYRGHVGRVTKVEGSKVTGHVTVKWPDCVSMAAQCYSAAWSRENLLVSLCDLSTDYKDFGGKQYVGKYARFAIAAHQADAFLGRIMPHAAMKDQVDNERRKAAKQAEHALRYGMSAHHLTALLGTPVRIDVLKPLLDSAQQLEPGLYTAKLQVAEPKPAKKVWDFPVLVRRTGTERISVVNDDSEWELLRDGEYEIFNKVSSVTIKPVSKKEIVFS